MDENKEPEELNSETSEEPTENSENSETLADEFKPLTEEERRENLRKLIGEEQADDFFDGYMPVSSNASAGQAQAFEKNSLINWKLISVFGAIFLVVLWMAFMISGNRVQEETVAPGLAPVSSVQETNSR